MYLREHDLRTRNLKYYMCTKTLAVPSVECNQQLYYTGENGVCYKFMQFWHFLYKFYSMNKWSDKICSSRILNFSKLYKFYSMNKWSDKICSPRILNFSKIRHFHLLPSLQRSYVFKPQCLGIILATYNILTICTYLICPILDTY